jgi:ring-1,2-phenylacetyl-CoA epoxidase subunit PaaD
LVPDPEVPAISIVELGIVRDVRLETTSGGTRVAIVLTTTYSGCPATAMIETMVRDELAGIGATGVDIAYRLAPPWTTDWIAPEAKAKLRAFGIAPPHFVTAAIDVAGISPLRRPGVTVPCPRCASTQTTLLAQFGSTACKAQYRCNACLEPFDYFKPH